VLRTREAVYWLDSKLSALDVSPHHRPDGGDAEAISERFGGGDAMPRCSAGHSRVAARL